jgi:signal transduction histidine kinase
VDVHQLIESAVKIGGNLLRKKNIEIVRHFADVPEIVCSPAQINQVLLNLITNAAQAIGHEQGRIALRTHAVGQYLMIAVEDNGAGIPAEHLARIFDPFFTTKPIGQGTGLGLSICFQIIQQHQGRIRAVSTPGVGTRFFIALPIRGRGESDA